MNLEPETVFKTDAEVGEGPVWDKDLNVLYWVDIEKKQVHALDPATHADRVWELGQRVGCAVLRKKGGLVLAMENGFFLFNTKTGDVTPLVDPEADLPENRFNDGKVDAAGRFWAGTMNIKGPRRPEGSLYCLEKDLSVRRVIKDATVPNGLDWSPDTKTFYFIDTPTRRVLAYEFDVETGRLGKPRVAFDLSAERGRPDGMCIDAEGMLWVAKWGGWGLDCWNPETGKRLLTVPFPVANVTSCAFGGKNYNELFVTTANSGLNAEELKAQPLAGSVFRLRPEVGGLPPHYYEG